MRSGHPKAVRLAIRACVSLLLASLWLTSTVAAEGRRVAYVIGNGDYTAAADMPSLPNPPNDARGVAHALRELDFEVVEVIDGEREATIRGLRRFGRLATGAEIALFYYAGHGLQADGENHLMPTDASIEIPGDLDYESLSLSQVKAELDRADAKLSLLVLDACRNNPLSRTLKARAAQLGRSASTGSGLARTEGATGMLIAYATDPGNVALDGRGSHSPFTAALIDHIDDPVDVRLMFGRVREKVHEVTNGAQTPWVEEAVLGEYQLSRKVPQRVDDAGERKAWERAVAAGDRGAYIAFLHAYPRGAYARRACRRVNQLSSGDSPWAGVRMSCPTDRPQHCKPGATGVEVTEVHPNSPAEVYGLKAGDVITGIANVPIKDMIHFMDVHRNQKICAPVTFRVHRDGRELIKEVSMWAFHGE